MNDNWTPPSRLRNQHWYRNNWHNLAGSTTPFGTWHEPVIYSASFAYDVGDIVTGECVRSRFNREVVTGRIIERHDNLEQKEYRIENEDGTCYFITEKSIIGDGDDG